MAPEDGRGFSCYFPMPFQSSGRWTIENESSVEALVYYYIDYELFDDPDQVDGQAYFHAQWHRENPTQGVSDEGWDNREWLVGGSEPSDPTQNYVILEATGRGHFVGCHLDIENLRDVPDDVFNWYGEGDDMFFIDGESWPPSLHGTGTEDYFGTAWCPTQEYNGPYHGVILPGGPNWSGKISLYRYHIEDPVRFRESMRVTIEHGHANRRSDDVSSTAYWYQTEPHQTHPPLLPVDQRLPR
ncbi:MAG: glycoside hydrolase family 172 protein [Thermomicrobiales bacterium]